jgi:hypothetical protein
MAIDLINGTDADIAAFGGGSDTVTKRSIMVSAPGTTDAQAAAGVQANTGTAAMKSASTNAQRALAAGVLLDSIITSVDLSTPVKREAFRLKRGLQELIDVCQQIGA